MTILLAFSVSFGFILPINAPQNMVCMGTDTFTPRQFTRVGLYLTVIGYLLLLLFARSLWQPQTLIERLARLQDPQLPPEAIRYTRRVTQVWCGFFVVNGTLALGTILLGDMALWSLYNGLLSYLLMGSLMGGEWLLRRRLQARLAASSLEAQS